MRILSLAFAIACGAGAVTGANAAYLDFSFTGYDLTGHAIPYTFVLYPPAVVSFGNEASTAVLSSSLILGLSGDNIMSVEFYAPLPPGGLYDQFVLSSGSSPTNPGASDIFTVTSGGPLFKITSNGFGTTTFSTGTFTIEELGTGEPDTTLTVSEIAFLPSVPEPATWAMTITGFGLVGGAMRQRRRSTASYA